MKQIINIISRITLALMGEGRGVGLLLCICCAMSPMKMWAEGCIIQINGQEYGASAPLLSLHAGDQVKVCWVDMYNVRYGLPFDPLYNISTCGCGDISVRTDNFNGFDTYSIPSDGIYKIWTSDDRADYETNMDESGTKYNFTFAQAVLNIHKLKHVAKVPAADCTHTGTKEYYTCESNECSKKIVVDTNGEITDINSLSIQGIHNYQNGTCTACSNTDPFYGVVSGIEPTISSAFTYPWAVSTVEGYKPGLMSTNPKANSSKSTMAFTLDKDYGFTFDYTISSQANATLTVTIDGKQALSYTYSYYQTPAIQHFGVNLSAGTHEVELYYNWGSAKNDDNKALLYNINFCNHSGDTSEGVHSDASCTTSSYDSHTCSVCGMQYRSNVQNDQLPHCYVNGKCNGCGEMPASMTASSFVDGTAYERTSDGTVGTLTYERTYYNNDWNCLYVPFKADVTDFTDCDIYTINMFQEHDSDGDGTLDELTLEVNKATSGKILPNHPYLIKYKFELTDAEKTNGKVVSINMSDILLKPATTDGFSCSSMSTNYMFKGTYSTISAATATNGTYYTIIKKDGKHVIGKTTDGLKPQRWYMTMEARESQFGTASSSSSQAKFIRIVADDEEEEATGIESLTPALSQGEGVGKYLENGKVVILRNGKKYNLNGQVIK